MPTLNKVLVGIFVGGCLLLFGVGLFLIGDSNKLFTKSFEVHADFSKITGIANGSKVRVAGMDAGTVTDIEVPSRPDGKFRIHFRIVEKLHPLVRQDSIASIQTDGLLGNKYLQVNAGSPNVAMAEDKSMIAAMEPFDWSDLMEQISSAVDQVDGILAGTKEELTESLQQIQEVSKSANALIQDATPQVQSILASADRVGANLGDIVTGVQHGKGTVGALFKDEELQASLKSSVATTGKTLDSFRQTAESVQTVAKDVEESDIVPEIQRTVANLRQITVTVQQAVDQFESAGAEGGVIEDLQRTLAHANETMSNLSDNTEAMKRNFFLRGFFKRRGFYNLGALTTAEYLDPDFGKGFKQHRTWLASTDLFAKDSKGVERLTPEGKQRLDAAVTAVMALPRNGPLIIEGYAEEGTPAQQFILARHRAARVESYVISRFELRPGYVGIVSMGTQSPTQRTPSGLLKTGVEIVSYYK
jgi:phospholipid/cholesterol/gamma-HCH transport system substrate-binding protein